MFFDAEKCQSTHHNYHAFHHNPTIKKPRSAHQFPQNPCKNTDPPSPKNIAAQTAKGQDHSRPFLILR
jgi:hypothetical protein